MRNDKHLAIKLRKQGKSYNAISKELKVSKSTLSGWFSAVYWSQIVKKELTRKAQINAKKQLRLMAIANKEKWELWREQFRISATKEFDTLKENPLFWAGIMLYWGEGDSDIKNPIRLSNVSPEIIRLFIKFLIHICKAPKEKIKISLIIYPDLNEQSCKKFWIRQVKLSKKNFYKTQIIYGKHPTKKLKYGICNVIVISRGLKEKLQQWQIMGANVLLSAGVV